MEDVCSRSSLLYLQQINDCLGLNPVCRWPDTQRWNRRFSLLMRKCSEAEIKCCPSLCPSRHMHILYPPYPHTHTYTHMHCSSSHNHLCLLPLRSAYLSPSGRQSTATPLWGSVGVHTGVRVSWAAWANMGSGGDLKSNPYVAPMLPFFFTPARRLSAKEVQKC